MKRVATLLTFAWVLFSIQDARATLDLTLRKGFDLNWYFYNTSTKYDDMLSVSNGYYRDYNGDGLPDYLFRLHDTTTGDWRLFCIDTSPTAAAKTYPADRTAWRDFTAQPGTFMPDELFMPYDSSMDSPDLVVVGTNKASASSDDFTQLIFRRLNKADPQWPTEATWTIDGASSTTQVYWPQVSFNADAYPDFLVYNRQANAGRQFVVTCYDGRTGTQIWTRPLDLDAEDPATGIPAIPEPLGYPTLNVSVPSEEGPVVGSDDFDGDGKPDILLYYSFAYFNLLGGGMKAVADVNLLDSNGNFVTSRGYSSTWTRVYEHVGSFWAPGPLPQTDFDKDGFVDLLLVNTATMADDERVFSGFSLKDRRQLFQADPTDFDFGDMPWDLNGYISFGLLKSSPFVPADLDGDGWPDLYAFRPLALSGSGLRIGMFNAYAGGTAKAGSKMWINEFNGYHSAHHGTFDFNNDGFRDFVIVDWPTSGPDIPNPGKVTWHVADLVVSPTGLTKVKEFDYSPPHTFSYNPATDDFFSFVTAFSAEGDIDGDGLEDVYGATACYVDNGTNGVIDKSYGFLFIYDNTPDPTSADYSAEMAVEVTGDDWTPLFFMISAQTSGGQAPVDNNEDAFPNDVIVFSPRAIFALSYKYHVAPNLPGKATNPHPPNGSDAPLDTQLSWTPGANATSNDVYFGTDLTSVTNADRMSPEYRGNQTASNAPCPIPLQAGHDYFWRIDCRNAEGVTKGDIWAFRAMHVTQSRRWRLYR